MVKNEGVVIKKYCLLFLFLFLGPSAAQNHSTHQDLVDLFHEWRDFENPPLVDGAPDYTRNRLNKDHGKFRSLQRRLNDIDFSGWSNSEKIDWHVVRAEMNGYDFNYKILRPWEKRPCFLSNDLDL